MRGSPGNAGMAVVWNYVTANVAGLAAVAFEVIALRPI